ncbi:MAG TPA: hypothetical protein VE908_18020 [Mycobacterium sp.]|jgi:hypothetical protein|nr:hypothetical protein [Mycobacterium sp.]
MNSLALRRSVVAARGVDAGSDSAGLIEDVQRRLKHLDQAAAGVESSPVRRSGGRAQRPRRKERRVTVADTGWSRLA